jgi:hypothetical protein
MTLVYIKLTKNFGCKEVKLTQVSLTFESKDRMVCEMREEVSVLRK